MNEQVRDNESDSQQAAVIPVRRTDTQAIQVCLIRRKNSAKWGVPKGYIEHGDGKQAALDEAYEEAGLSGQLIGESIGTYDYKKGDVTLTVIVFVMEVLEEQTVWREKKWRERQWYSLEEVGERLKDHPVWPLFNRIRRVL